MDAFEQVDGDTKMKLVDAWREMSDIEKMHFINQVALSLSVWGSDDQGKRLVVDALRIMIGDGSRNLVDFGLYVDRLLNGNQGRNDKIRRAALLLEGYRIKNALPSEPHKELM